MESERPRRSAVRSFRSTTTATLLIHGDLKNLQVQINCLCDCEMLMRRPGILEARGGCGRGGVALVEARTPGRT
ncbi:hypothetical protein E2C01_048601 [Portunus trituberculatus]|uniref:Uncharacterized protein n=1 Tax=Portunus trituberculatus TaxID=210409 RepID=A0A5B7GBE1_PORTR|nr:hypothetical protein [Portunus trituberculatus]